MRVIYLGVVAVLAVACARPVNVLERTQAPVLDERVILNTKSPIRYGEVITRREGLILHVQVALENTARSDQPFEYRWEWTDADGFQLGDTLSSWQPGYIAGRGQKLLTGTGPGPGAVNFRLYIRRPER